MKKVFCIVLACVLMFSLMVGCGSTKTPANTPANTSAPTATTQPTASSNYDKLNIKISLSGSEQGVDYLSAVKFKEIVEKESGGQIKVEIFPNALLASGNMHTQLELLLQGDTFEMAVLGDLVLVNAVPKFKVINIPFTFSSYEKAEELMDGTGGEWLKKEFAEKKIVYLSGLHNGLQQLTNNKVAVKTPADIKNLKIRVIGDVQNGMFRTFGADPISMSFGEIFSALQNKTIDGQVNGFQTADSINLSEVQKYCTVWNATYATFFFVANDAFYARLNDMTKALIDKASQEAAVWGREYIRSTEQEIREKWEKAGVTVIDLTDAERQAFIDALEELRSSIKAEVGEEACAAWGIK